MTVTWSLFDKELQNYLKEILDNPVTKKAFSSWLFDFVCREKNNRKEEDKKVYVEDLKLLLTVLKDDGITLENLLCENISENVADLTQQADILFKGYTFYNKDYLCKSEFLPLANLIVQNYRIKNEGIDVVFVGNYELRRKLGEGSEGCVRLAVNCLTGEKKAVKMFSKSKAINMEHLRNEITALRKLNHENIVRLEDVIESSDMIYFVEELCPGGSLAEHVSIAPFTQPVARNFFKQLLSGVKYCHDNGVIHRDLKLENLILNREGTVLKICDFGHSSVIMTDWDYVQSAMVGSLYHIAPEQLADGCYRGKKADVWSIGVILYRMLTGKFPFYSKNPVEVMNLIKNVSYSVPDNFPKDVAELLSHIFVVDSEQRYSVEDIQKSPFCQSDAVLPLSFLKRTIVVESKITTEKNALELMKNALENNKITLRKSIREINSFQCFSIEQQMKFVVALRVGREGNSPYFEFIMTDGAGIDFRNLLEKIKDEFLENIDDIEIDRSERSLESLFYESSQSLLPSYIRSYEDTINKNKANVLLCGKTGCGKSTIVNRFFNKNTEIKPSVNQWTKHYSKFVHPNKPIIIYDSKGIELKPNNDFLEETKSFLDAHTGTEQIRCIWYVVDGSIGKFDSMDEEICRKLDIIPQLIIVINKADLLTVEQIEQLKKEIREKNFKNCTGIVSTISSTVNVANVNIAMQRCKRCKSNDICLFMIQRIIFCNNCGYESSVENQSDVDESSKLLDMTVQTIPVVMQDLFISTQTSSFKHKLTTSYKYIKEYDSKRSTDPDKELKKFLRFLMKINKLWNISDSLSLKVASKVISNNCCSVKEANNEQNDNKMVYDINQFTPIAILWSRCLYNFHLVCSIIFESLH